MYLLLLTPTSRNHQFWVSSEYSIWPSSNIFWNNLIVQSNKKCFLIQFDWIKPKSYPHFPKSDLYETNHFSPQIYSLVPGIIFASKGEKNSLVEMEIADKDNIKTVNCKGYFKTSVTLKGYLLITKCHLFPNVEMCDWVQIFLPPPPPTPLSGLSLKTDRQTIDKLSTGCFSIPVKNPSLYFDL